MSHDNARQTIRHITSRLLRAPWLRSCSIACFMSSSCVADVLPTLSCVPGSTTPCYSGPPDTEGVGICSAGVKTCDSDGTSYGPCEGEVLPAPEENCATPADDDCDGKTQCPEPCTWTQWYDKDDPASSGDFEERASEMPPVCANPLFVECKTVEGKTLTETGEVVTCTPTDGFLCLNANQPDGTCLDYMVRFCCP